MKKFFIGFFVTLMTFSAFTAYGAELDDFVPANSQGMVKIDFSNLTKRDFFRKIFIAHLFEIPPRTLASQPALFTASQKKYREFVSQTGFDILGQFQEVLLFLPKEELSQFIPSPALIIKGNFAPEKLLKTIEGNASYSEIWEEKNVEGFSAFSNKISFPELAVFFDRQTLIMGETTDVLQCLHTKAEKKKKMEPNSLQNLSQQVAKRGTLWGIVIATKKTKSALAENVIFAPLAKVQNVNFSIHFANDLDFMFEAILSDSKNPEKVKEIFDLCLALLKFWAPQISRETYRALKFENVNCSYKITWHISRTQIEEAKIEFLKWLAITGTRSDFAYRLGFSKLFQESEDN